MATIIQDLTCPLCGKDLWCALTEPDTVEEAWTGVDPDSFKCTYCKGVFPIPGHNPEIDGPPKLSHPWETYRTPNAALRGERR